MSLGETVLKPAVMAVLGAALVVGSGVGVGGKFLYDCASGNSRDLKVCTNMWSDLYNEAFSDESVDNYVEVLKNSNSPLIKAELASEANKDVARLRLANRLLVIRISELKKDKEKDHKADIEEAKAQIKANKAEVKKLKKGTPEGAQAAPKAAPQAEPPAKED